MVIGIGIVGVTVKRRKKKLKQQNKYMYCYFQHTSHADRVVDEVEQKRKNISIFNDTLTRSPRFLCQPFKAGK